MEKCAAIIFVHHNHRTGFRLPILRDHLFTTLLSCQHHHRIALALIPGGWRLRWCDHDPLVGRRSVWGRVGELPSLPTVPRFSGTAISARYLPFGGLLGGCHGPTPFVEMRSPWGLRCGAHLRYIACEAPGVAGMFRDGGDRDPVLGVAYPCGHCTPPERVGGIKKTIQQRNRSETF